MAPPQKISLYNVNDLKNTTDDALAPYLTTLPKPYTFTQQHTLTDIRLIAGYSAVTIAGLLFYFDWKHGWDATKPYTLPACVAYFVLNGFLTYWVWAVEKGMVFVGVREGAQKITLKSSSQKHTPSYNLHIKYSAPSGQIWDDRTITGSFTDWFNVHGYIDQKAFKRWLATNIEVIGLADPGSKAVAEKAYADVVDSVTAAAVVTGMDSSASARGGTATTTTSTSTPASSKKSKKKA